MTLFDHFHLLNPRVRASVNEPTDMIMTGLRNKARELGSLDMAFNLFEQNLKESGSREHLPGLKSAYDELKKEEKS